MAKEMIVTPDTWLQRGEAAVTEGRRVPLIVFGGIVGEAANVKVVYKGQNQHQALFDHTDTPSDLRMQIPCDRYEPCGGCPLMHVAPEGQTEIVTFLLDTDQLHQSPCLIVVKINVHQSDCEDLRLPDISAPNRLDPVEDRLVCPGVTAGRHNVYGHSAATRSVVSCRG